MHDERLLQEMMLRMKIVTTEESENWNEKMERESEENKFDPRSCIQEMPKLVIPRKLLYPLIHMQKEHRNWKTQHT